MHFSCPICTKSLVFKSNLKKDQNLITKKDIAYFFEDLEGSSYIEKGKAVLKNEIESYSIDYESSENFNSIPLKGETAEILCDSCDTTFGLMAEIQIVELSIPLKHIEKELEDVGLTLEEIKSECVHNYIFKTHLAEGTVSVQCSKCKDHKIL